MVGRVGRYAEKDVLEGSSFRRRRIFVRWLKVLDLGARRRREKIAGRSLLLMLRRRRGRLRLGAGAGWRVLLKGGGTGLAMTVGPECFVVGWYRLVPLRLLVEVLWRSVLEQMKLWTGVKIRLVMIDEPDRFAPCVPRRALPSRMAALAS